MIVIGVGSPHGDDRIAWAAIQALRGNVKATAIALREVATPADMLDHLEGITKLVVVDGCRAGQAPGTVIRFDWPSAELQFCRAASSHGLGLVEVLTLANVLGRLPPEATIVLMEIADAAPGDELSPSVSKALPELVSAVLNEIHAVEAAR